MRSPPPSPADAGTVCDFNHAVFVIAGIEIIILVLREVAGGVIGQRRRIDGGIAVGQRIDGILVRAAAAERLNAYLKQFSFNANSHYSLYNNHSKWFPKSSIVNASYSVVCPLR